MAEVKAITEFQVYVLICISLSSTHKLLSSASCLLGELPRGNYSIIPN